MPDQFWSLRPDEFPLILQGVNRRIEWLWMQTREIVAATYNASANRDFSKPATTGKDIIPLAIDSQQPKVRKRKAKPVSKAVIEAFLKGWHKSEQLTSA